MGNFLLMQSEPSSSSRAVATAAPMGLLLLNSSCCCCQRKSSSSSSSRVAAAAKMGLLLLLQELLPLPKWVLFCCFFKGSCYPSKFSSSSSPSDMIATKIHCKSSEALSLICVFHLSHLSLSNLTCDLC
jgi:hypothetical protein